MRLFCLLALALAFTAFAAAQLGAADIPLSAWRCHTPDCQTAAHILWNIRLPRTLSAILIGAMLAISGAAMQGVFCNPLIDPGIIGVTGGAGLAASLYLVLLAPLMPNASLYALPIAAFAGSWLAAMSLYLLSRRQGQIHIAILLLIGIVFAALTGAAAGLITYLADDRQLRSLTFWSMGSLGGISWPMTAMLAVSAAIAVPLILRHARVLNALTLGEAAAEHLGHPVDTAKNSLSLLLRCSPAPLWLSQAA